MYNYYKKALILVVESVFMVRGYSNDENFNN